MQSTLSVPHTYLHSTSTLRNVKANLATNTQVGPEGHYSFRTTNDCTQQQRYVMEQLVQMPIQSNIVTQVGPDGRYTLANRGVLIEVVEWRCPVEVDVDSC